MRFETTLPGALPIPAPEEEIALISLFEIRIVPTDVVPGNPPPIADPFTELVALIVEFAIVRLARG
jgi:hypothetical protein